MIYLTQSFPAFGGTGRSETLPSSTEHLEPELQGLYLIG